jgi:nitric oxide reductase large subunit
MKYLYAYLGHLYYILGTLGLIFLIGNSFASLDALPLYLIYLSLAVAFVGPIKLLIENNS